MQNNDLLVNVVKCAHLIYGEFLMISYYISFPVYIILIRIIFCYTLSIAYYVIISKFIIFLTKKCKTDCKS